MQLSHHGTWDKFLGYSGLVPNITLLGPFPPNVKILRFKCLLQISLVIFIFSALIAIRQNFHYLSYWEDVKHPSVSLAQVELIR